MDAGRLIRIDHVTKRYPGTTALDDLSVEHAGPSIAAAGLILAGTFASLMFAEGTFFKAMGFSFSVGIAMAAFVMALFLTPALTALIGHAAWWPGHGDRATTDTVEKPAEEPVLES